MGQYSINISIGTQKEQFRMVIDTGSGNIVVPGSECNTQGCLNKGKYDRNLMNGKDKEQERSSFQ